MIEIEKTYLAKFIPEDLEKFPSREIIDIYFPAASSHPVLRLRKNGDKFNMTKKYPLDEHDAGSQREETIALSEGEFKVLKNVEGKVVRKLRYYYDCPLGKADVDVFQDELAGLVLVDFEFENEKQRDSFIAPDFCLVEVTQEEFVAGGMLCGKKYEDIEKDLTRFSYKKIIL